MSTELEQLRVERDEARASVQRMYDHFILWCRDRKHPPEVWSAGSVLLNAALPLRLRRVVEEETVARNIEAQRDAARELAQELEIKNDACQAENEFLRAQLDTQTSRGTL